MLKQSALALVIGCAMTSTVFAQDASLFKWSGFGTLAATHFSRNDIDFVGGPAVPNGAGATDSVSFKTDSKVGLQLVVSPTSNLDVTIQTLVKQTARDNFDPSLEVANVKYAFNDNASIRVGRIGHPFFMISDYRQVNYVSTALRPSVEVYRLVPFTHSDVIEGLFRFGAGPGQVNIQTGIGQSSDDLPPTRDYGDHDTGKVKKMAYFNANYEVGAWNLRAGTTIGDITYNNAYFKDKVFNPLSALGPVGSRIRNQWEVKDANASFSGIGATYDSGNVIVTGEYVMLRAGKAYNDTDAWTLLGGYRIGKFTPYVSYGSARTRDRNRADGVASALGELGVPALRAAAVQGAIQAFADGSVEDQNTASIGMRWDVAKNIALKVQYDHIKIKSPSTKGMLTNASADYVPRSGGNVVAASLDFIF